MKLIVFIAILFVAICAAKVNMQTDRFKFASFILKYNKMYKSDVELEKRFNIFRRNLKRMDYLTKTSKHAVYGVTKFADLTPEEFSHMYLMKKHPKPDYSRAPLFVSNKPIGALPDQFDWRDQNPDPVTPVKNQGQCGSCWAFSAVETVESVWILAGKKKEILSEQQVVSCDKTDYGCNGGDTITAFDYIIKAGGLETEAEYPYTAQNGHCEFKEKDVVSHIKSYHYITKNKNETQMQYGLVQQGPLSICVDASSWQFYQGGIIKNHCGQQLDHCVQITGFGTDKDIKYWNVRNSWGTDWGINGYLKVEIGKNLCGIADEVTIAVV